MRRGALVPAALGALLAWAAPAWGQVAPITDIELASAAPLPEALVRAALVPMTGRPLSRDAVRESLERLWALDLFSDIRVEEVEDAAGRRLRFQLTRKAWVERVEWEGETGLSRAELAAEAALALHGDAGEARLARAREQVLALLGREGYFAARTRVIARTDPRTQATAVTFAVAAGERARIRPLRIQGLVRYPLRKFRGALGVKSGARYREEAVRGGIRAAQERMREAGFFQAAVRADPPEWDAATNEVALAIHVTEGPEYRVEFVGDRKLRESTLRKALPFVAAGLVDQPAVENGERSLRAAYREPGYHFAEVHGELRLDADPRLIRYRVSPGPRVKVARVEFDGNRVFKANRLRDLMQTRSRALFRSGDYREDTLERDLRVLLAFYRSQGMPGTTVGPPEVTFSDDRRRAAIRIPIEEGQVVRVAAVGVEGAAAISAETILAALPVKSGTAWSESLAEEIRRVVSGLYAAMGYLSAEVAIQEFAREGWVDLSVRVREGELMRAGRVLVSGLVRTREEVVRRELPLQPAGPFDPSALLEAERRLGELGIFERLELTPLRPPPAPFTDVAVRVQEAKAWRLDLGAGYSTDDGPRASLEIGHDNVRGTARRLSLRQKISRIEDRTDLTYQQPWTFGTRWALTGNLFRERREEIGFDVERAGGAAEIQRELLAAPANSLRAALRYELRWVRRSDVDPALVQEAVTPGAQIIGSLRPSLTWDRRDNPLNPARGSLHVLAVEGAGAPLGSEASFVKSELTTTWLFDWLRPTVIGLSAQVGLATAFAGTEELPIEERFFAGGEATIRGYGRNQVGPRDDAGNPRGGNARLLFNAEWRFPIWRFVNGALFVDTGTVRPEIVDLRLSEFKTGVGGGLRLVTPVGPLRFDVGYGLNPVQADRDRLALYFSVGYPF